MNFVAWTLSWTGVLISIQYSTSQSAVNQNSRCRTGKLCEFLNNDVKLPWQLSDIV